jgi:hypothetical protein
LLQKYGDPEIVDRIMKRNQASDRTCCEGRCEIEEGPSMAAETARCRACHASAVALIENDQGEPLSESTVRSEPVNRLFQG